MKTSKMRCCVPFCETTAETVSESMGITFHEFPSEEHLCAAWHRALGKQDSLPHPAVVCSQHFLNDDFCATESGSRQIRTGAVPTTVQVCMICLDTRSKLLLMSKYKLEEAYRHLVGPPLCDQGNLRQTLCVQCARRLVNFNKFRDKSLRAQALMMELVEQHEIITMKHIKSIDRVTHQLESDIVKTVSEPNHCDMYIQSDADIQTELDAVAVKCEESHDSMSVDADHTQHMPVREDDNNADSFNGHSIAYKEKYLSDGSHPTEIKDSLLTTSSISKEEVVEKVAPIKQEISFACTTCLMEFADEDVYVKHTLMHMEDVASPDDHSVAHNSHTLVAPLPVGLATNRENEVHSTDTNSELTVEVFHNNEAIVQDLRQSQITIIQPTLTQINNSVNLHMTRRNERLNNKPSDTDYGETENKTLQDSIFGTALRNRSKQKQYICNVCQKIFKRKDCLIRHFGSRYCGKTLSTCHICKYQVKNNIAFLQHMRVHTGEKPFACELCNYRCSRKPYLVEHMKTHTGEKPFACELCDFKFSRRSSLSRHNTRTHIGDKLFVCELCDYKSTVSNNLVKHKKTHTGEKPFACELCDSKFAFNYNLVRHMSVHTGERRFACEFCDYKSSCKSTLLRHTRTHSVGCTAKKPLACELCDYKTLCKSTLMRHSRTHNVGNTGETPLACELCDYKFSCKSNLMRHKRTHSVGYAGKTPLACELCDYKCSRKKGLAKHMITHTAQ